MSDILHTIQTRYKHVTNMLDMLHVMHITDKHKTLHQNKINHSYFLKK